MCLSLRPILESVASVHCSVSRTTRISSSRARKCPGASHTGTARTARIHWNPPLISETSLNTNARACKQSMERLMTVGKSAASNQSVAAVWEAATTSHQLNRGSQRPLREARRHIKASSFVLALVGLAVGTAHAVYATVINAPPDSLQYVIARFQHATQSLCRQSALPNNFMLGRPFASNRHIEVNLYGGTIGASPLRPIGWQPGKCQGEQCRSGASQSCPAHCRCVDHGLLPTSSSR